MFNRLYKPTGSVCCEIVLQRRPETYFTSRRLQKKKKKRKREKETASTVTSSAEIRGTVLTSPLTHPLLPTLITNCGFTLSCRPNETDTLQEHWRHTRSHWFEQLSITEPLQALSWQQALMLLRCMRFPFCGPIHTLSSDITRVWYSQSHKTTQYN